MITRSLLSIFFICSVTLAYTSPTTISENLKIDQFGYFPNTQKIAIISNPINGFNNTESFSPSTGTNQYQVRRWSDDVVMFSGTLTVWNGGAIHSQSGDQVWWFDFSNLSTAGSYYIYDVGNDVGSYEFEIGTAVFDNVLKQTFRTFYYQRCGTTKATPHAEAAWADAPCHIGANQDTDCRLYNNQNTSTSRDLSGGWHDAGDYNKYVNFTWAPVIDLLLAYDEKPSFWGDNMDIPESGNGVPDLLDEIKYELDWLLKMQESNGSVLSVVGTQNFASDSPPSADAATRLYGPATTSASFTAAGIFALAAKIYSTIPSMNAYATTLETAAINAWNWASTNPNTRFYNTNVLASGENELKSINAPEENYTYNLLARQLTAACFLFALTDNSTYQSFFDANYDQMHMIQWYFIYSFEHIEQDMLLYYSKLPNATEEIANTIQSRYVVSMTQTDSNLPAFLNETDAYRANLVDNDYVWGSNAAKARQGMLMTNMLNYNLDNSNDENYKNGAWGFMHYFHGVNPLCKTYLSNMGNHGGDNSVDELYHAWFEDGSSLWDHVETSSYGPAPGILVGGANGNYGGLDGCCPNNCGDRNSYCDENAITPPLGQPVQKSYKEWNVGWPQNSWEITENSISYQASYLRFLVNLLESAPLSTTVSDVMTSFSTKATTSEKVALEWSVNRSSDFHYFEIERSNNERDFSLIKKVWAEEKMTYQSIDASPIQGDNYYRLKIISKDGSFTYSSIKMVRIAPSNWTIVPNPATDDITLQTQKNTTIQTVRISDLTGKMYGQYLSSDLRNKNRISVGHLPSGVYVLYIETKGERSHLKFVKK